MKPVQKVNKSPNNPQPVKLNAEGTKNNPPKLRAEIIQQKIPKQKQSSSESQSVSYKSSFDAEVQDFANQFYDQAVEKADKSLQKKQDNQPSPQKSSEQTSIIKKKSTYQKIQYRLEQLKSNYNDLDLDSILFKKKDEKKLKQIAQFLSKKHMQKRQFKKKLKRIKKSQKQRKKIEEQMKQKQQKQKHSKRVRQIRKISCLIKQKVQKKKQQEEQNLQKVEQFYEQFHKKYKSRKIYQLMQLSLKKRLNKQIQTQKQYLRQRKSQKAQILGSQDILLFKKRHSQLLKDLQKIKQAQKNQRYHQIAFKNKQLRDRIYISNHYLQIQEEETKKEKIKAIPKEKLSKARKYNSYVRENFMPPGESNQENQENADQRLKYLEEQQVVEINGKIFRQVKKIRYLKGQKIGEFICSLPQPKSQDQINMVGNSYLQQLKLLPKKRHSTSLDLSRMSELKTKAQTARSKIQIPKITKKLGSIHLPKDANRYQVQNLIKSLKAKDEFISRKQHYLRVANKNGPSGNYEKSQLDDNLLDNIEKKINLLGRL